MGKEVEKELSDCMAAISEKAELLQPELMATMKTKVSAQRARKLSSELTALYKDFRKLSVDYYKK
jgi:hypothetical protein